MLECFDKERVCDSQDHVWSRERGEREGEEAEAGSGADVVGQTAWHLRGLRAGGELLELAVVDGEVRAVVAAELEGLHAAAGRTQLGGEHSRACPVPWHPSHQCLAHLVKASTISEDTAGEGARTTSGSPRSISSHSICTWVSTGWKHLPQGVRVRETGRSAVSSGPHLPGGPSVKTWKVCSDSPPLLAWPCAPFELVALAPAGPSSLAGSPREGQPQAANVSQHSPPLLSLPLPTFLREPSRPPCPLPLGADTGYWLPLWYHSPWELATG